MFEENDWVGKLEQRVAKPVYEAPYEARCLHCLEVSYFMVLLAEKTILKARLATISNLSILLAFTKAVC